MPQTWDVNEKIQSHPSLLSKYDYAYSSFSSWIGFLGSCFKILHTRWIKQQEFISSSSWRLDGQVQGVGSVGFLRPLSVAVFSLCPHSAYLCPNLFVIRTLRNILDQGPLQMALFYLNYFFIEPISTHKSHTEELDVKTSTYEFGRIQFSPWQCHFGVMVIWQITPQPFDNYLTIPCFTKWFFQFLSFLTCYQEQNRCG